MKIVLHLLLALMLIFISACSSGPATIDSLSETLVSVAPRQDLNISRAQAIAHYRQFIKLAPDSPMYPQALRRLAELEILNAEEANTSGKKADIKKARRQANDAIQLYSTYLSTYPDNPDNDYIYYQQAKAYELRGDIDKSIALLKLLTQRYPHSRYFEEAHFRRGEILFSQQRYVEAEQAFHIIGDRPQSPYREKALYKYGWSLFKQSRYDAALNAFFILLDAQQEYGLTDAMNFPEHLSKTDKALLEDIMRAISLTVSYKEGTKTLEAYLSRHMAQQYEALLYNSLGKMYLDKHRYIDAANTFLAFIKRHPNNRLAPEFHQQIIYAYKTAGLSRQVLSSKADFVKRYGHYSPYWMTHDENIRQRLTPLLNQHIQDLAGYYHAASRKRHKKTDYRQAAYWYEYYLKSFPNESDTAAINFLLAEVLYEGKDYARAIAEFERSAYEYPLNEKSSEAAYAALLIYPKINKQLSKQGSKQQRNSWQQKEISSALRFSETFYEDKRAVSVLANTSEKLYALGDFRRTRDTARTLTRRMTVANKASIKRTAWIVLGHSSFELAEFKDAENAYIEALEYFSVKNKRHSERKQKKAIQERLAASIYKQGEAAEKLGEIELAIFHFSRIKKVAPTSKIRLTADYDAASLMIKSNKIADAQPLLEDLRRRYPQQSSLQAGITTKLAFIYSQSGQSLKAARELEKLALSTRSTTGAKEKRSMLWQSAELYTKAGHHKEAARLHKKYITLYPHAFDQSLEARQSLVEYYQRQKNHKRAYYWMNEIIKADRSAGSQRNDRSRYLAAHATLQLAAPSRYAYQKVRLTVPLKKSLKKKKKLMKRSLKAYQQAMQYKVAEVSTEATYEIAEIYNNFSRALMKSQRPKGLSAEALEQYDILLEEQAYPFEEKAIDIHQTNLKNMHQGIYDDWIKKSLKQLQKLQPIRYAKSERIDSHVSTLY